MTIKANYTVTGMTCGHCEASVKEEVGEIAGVTGVEADRATNSMTVLSDAAVDPAAVIAAVEEAGYEARPVDA
ncbi:heavy-metal-associated domain-containing protein [uncultured Corynebacterium sp.]|uniref:heavy-metal-associated domain-containing protein n=1 Tax=uncultured Corynebacterium sp. TaxID=159447 RepID=UPI0025E5EC55|nr:heavy metal-associated domain-containing protein [uncultured Corynebacterium sp.]